MEGPVLNLSKPTIKWQNNCFFEEPDLVTLILYSHYFSVSVGMLLINYCNLLVKLLAKY